MELKEYFNNILKEKNISIEKIFESTKIPKKFLLNLKNGEYDKFPPSVYAKGYLKELEKFLCIENNELINLYESIAQEIKVEEDFKYEPLLNIDEGKKNFKTIIAVLALIIFFIIIYFTFSNKNEKKSNPQISHSKLKKEKKINKVKVIPKIPLKKDKLEVIDNKTKNLIKNISQKIDNLSKNLKNEISEKAPLPDNNSYYIVTLEPLARVWVRIHIDNKTKRTFFLETKTINIDAKKFVKIDIGNAANLKIYINSRKYPLNGKKGEVKHILINLKNFINNDNSSR